MDNYRFFYRPYIIVLYDLWSFLFFSVRQENIIIILDLIFCSFGFAYERDASVRQFCVLCERRRKKTRKIYCYWIWNKFSILNRNQRTRAIETNKAKKQKWNFHIIKTHLKWIKWIMKRSKRKPLTADTQRINLYLENEQQKIIPFYVPKTIFKFYRCDHCNHRSDLQSFETYLISMWLQCVPASHGIHVSFCRRNLCAQ